MCGDEDELKSDPYCEVSLRMVDASGYSKRISSKKNTTTVEDDLNPVWMQTFSFERPDDLPQGAKLMLKFTIFDEDFYGMCSKYLGEREFDVTNVKFTGDYSTVQPDVGLKLIATKEIRGIVIKDAFPDDEYIGTLDICVATGEQRKPPPELGIKAIRKSKTSKVVSGVGKDLLSTAATPLTLLKRNKGDPDKTKSYHYLYITVLAGRSLVTPDITGDVDPYCEVIVNGPDNKKPQKTPILESTCNPEWDEKNILVFRADETTRHIRIKVYDYNRVHSTPTGEVLLRAPYAEAKPNPLRFETIDKWYNVVPGTQSALKHKRFMTNPAQPGVPQLGQLKVRLDWGYDPTPALTLPQRPRWRRNIGHLHVKIIDCEDLAQVDNSLLSGATDPFIVVEVEGREESTPTLMDTQNPVYNWECTFEVTEINTFMRLNFWDYDGGGLAGQDDQFGLVVIPIKHLLQDPAHVGLSSGSAKPHKLRLEILPPEDTGFHQPHSRKRGPKHLGWVNVELTFTTQKSLNYLSSAVLNPIATGLEVDEFSLVKTFAQTSRIVDTMLAPIRGLLRTIDLLQSWKLPGLNLTLVATALAMYNFIPVWLMWQLLPLYLLLNFSLYGYLIHRARLTQPVFFDKETRNLVLETQAKQQMVKLETARVERLQKEAEKEANREKTPEELELEAIAAAEEKRRKSKGFFRHVGDFVGDGVVAVVDAPIKIVGKVTSGGFIPMYDKIQAVMKTISEVTQMLEGVANDMERTGNLLVWADPTVTSRFVLWGILPTGLALILLWELLLWLALHITINQVLLVWHMLVLMPGRSTVQEVSLMIDGYMLMVPQLTLTPINPSSKYIIEAREREEKERIKANPPTKAQLAAQAKKDALNQLATSEGIKAYAAAAQTSWPVWMYHLQQRAPTNDELQSQWFFEYNCKHSRGAKHSSPASWDVGQRKEVEKYMNRELVELARQAKIDKKNKKKKKKKGKKIKEGIENTVGGEGKKDQ
eukprot:CAMPEP_0118947052 /NCGR_PEP_ID=MMETSP1169-20130426/45287_1 /TAXON_ID=36882 /ORGANISM="Pyramimonas obovata, Strain CCMP722" /LENGTH=988 /DNA_ID=CAMNT_0006893183 /DNA_START=49 /DNA_END=3015 /DNA_ORIENTATION=+